LGKTKKNGETQKVVAIETLLKMHQIAILHIFRTLLLSLKTYSFENFQNIHENSYKNVYENSNFNLVDHEDKLKKDFLIIFSSSELMSFNLEDKIITEKKIISRKGKQKFLPI